MRWISVYVGARLLLFSCDLAKGHPRESWEDVTPQGQQDITREFDVDTATSPDDIPDCKVHQLLPNLKNGPPGGWMKITGEHSPLYNCSCPYYKARYFCSGKPINSAPPVWRPHAVANGYCAPVTTERLRRNFLPDDYTVFLFANSHGRQIMESLLCRFSGQIVRRNVTTSETPRDIGSHKQQIIDLDSQCRGMSTYGQLALVKSGCISEDNKQAFRCKDDHASFYFKNGASFHYRFSDMPDKSIDREMASFGLAPTNVNAILVNVGNGPPLSLDSIASTAGRFKGSETLLLWLTTFGGRGYFHDPVKQKRLAERGVMQVGPRRGVPNTSMGGQIGDMLVSGFDDSSILPAFTEERPYAYPPTAAAPSSQPQNGWDSASSYFAPASPPRRNTPPAWCPC